jgi:beta-glucanase (GH16 family)
MANYKWVISQLDTAPSEDALTDVVKTIHWRYQATDADYSADIYGSMACATPSDTNFTAYDDLTQDDVISWLEAGLDVDAFKENLDKQIEDQKNPPIVNLPLPWNK